MTPAHDDQVQILAEDTARLLDFAGRVLGAIEDGKWHYAAEKAGQLEKVARQLSTHAENQQDNGERVTGDEVIEKVRVESRHYWLGRRLYPRQGGES